MFKKTELSVVGKILKHREIILSGVFLAVDPASKSLGFALYRQGVLDESGTIIADGKAPVGNRLASLSEQLGELATPDVMAVEKVRTGTGHVFLVWSAGTAVAATNAPVTIELPVSMWKKFVGKEHEKSDENDAIAIGDTIIHICKEY